MLTTGISPDKLKIAKVIPVYKKESKQYLVIIDQYHFYQLFQKYWETIILFEQLLSYIKDAKLLFGHQYGFRPKHSTECAALELVDRIIVQLDRDEMPINIYLDLSKAFDTIDHALLIAKFKYYGIHGI